MTFWGKVWDAISDMDHPIWVLFSGVYLLAVSLIISWANYNQFELDKDLRAALFLTIAYAVQSMVKRRIKEKQAS